MLQMLHVCGAKHYDCAAYLNAAADKTCYKFETRLTAAKLHIDQLGAGCSQLQTFQSRWVTRRVNAAENGGHRQRNAQSKKFGLRVGSTVKHQEPLLHAS